MFEYDFHSGGDDPEQYVRACSVKWTQDGIWLSEPSGHQQFIPKKSFIGGR
jgi:hypothetical protein